MGKKVKKRKNNKSSSPCEKRDKVSVLSHTSPSAFCNTDSTALAALKCLMSCFYFVRVLRRNPAFVEPWNSGFENQVEAVTTVNRYIDIWWFKMFYSFCHFNMQLRSCSCIYRWWWCRSLCTVNFSQTTGTSTKDITFHQSQLVIQTCLLSLWTCCQQLLWFVFLFRNPNTRIVQKVQKKVLKGGIRPAKNG